MEYSIVIPAYNEADKISSSLTQIVTFMKGFSESFEVVVVDDGSKDSTAQIVEDYARSNVDVRLIKNPHRGKGFAVYTGIMEAKGDLIYTADADLSAPISELKKLTVWVRDQNFDVSIASREGLGAQRVNEPLYRHIMGRGFNIFVQAVALPGISDSQCGFKLFKGTVAKDIFSRLKIYGDKVRDTDKPYFGAWDVEVLYIAKKLGYTVKQVPVVWTYVRTTRLSPIRDSVKMALDVLKIRLNDLKGQYNTAHKG